MTVSRRVSPAFLLLVSACGAAGSGSAPGPALVAPGPFTAGRPADHLIHAGEEHFAHLWQLTLDGENGEAYWSSDGSALVFQRRAHDLGIECDRIFVLGRDERAPRQVSNGRGVTTCSYFLPGGRRILFASTHGSMADCPPPLDPAEFQRLGYFWRVFPDFDLWTCDLEGGDLRQVTHTPGYDGGAFFSHDGRSLVFRSQVFTPGKEAEELEEQRALLAQWKVRPTHMELQISDADGSNRRAIRPLGAASFAPYFFPGDRRVIFSSNHHDPAQPPSPKREFDLFAIGVDGQDLEQITTMPSFDSFPMFSPDGRYLVFASNRGQAKPGETNLFLAEWK